MRVAVVADLLSERWTSMDLVADMLVGEIAKDRARGVEATLVRPEMPTRGRLLGRYITRYWDYPRWLRRNARGFDVYHVVDHSYAHVVHQLEAARTIVTCHDTDAFLPLVAPGTSRSRLPTTIVRRILSGLRKAAHVACPSAATRDELAAWSLVDPARITVVPNGVDAVFAARQDAVADAAIARMLGDSGTIDLLHVGTCIARKRIDRLLAVVAEVRRSEPRVRLVKAGGRLTMEQRALADRLGLTNHLIEVPFLEPSVLAALYRHAAVVIVPSDREGFGLPVAEAMACGTSVVATDLPVFREVGGDAVTFCRADDLDQWREAILGLIDSNRESASGAARTARNVSQASRFSWTAYARDMMQLYDRLSPDGLAVRPAVVPSR